MRDAKSGWLVTAEPNSKGFHQQKQQYVLESIITDVIMATTATIPRKSDPGRSNSQEKARKGNLASTGASAPSVQEVWGEAEANDEERAGTRSFSDSVLCQNFIL